MNDEWAGFTPVEVSPETAKRNIEAAGGRVTSTKRPTWITDETPGGPQSQERLYKLFKAGKGNPAAAPGHGAHETDDAIDFVGDPSTAGVPFKKVFWENDHYHGVVDRPQDDFSGFKPIDPPAPAAAKTDEWAGFTPVTPAAAAPAIGGAAPGALKVATPPEAPTSELDELGRQFHRGVGMVAGGVGDTLGLVANPLNMGLNMTGIPQALGMGNLTTDLGETARQAVGAPAPRNMTERFTDAIGEGMVGGGAFSKGAGILSGLASSTSVEQALKMMADTPLMDILSGGSSMGSVQVADELGIKNPYARMAFGIVGGGIPFGAHAAIKEGAPHVEGAPDPLLVPKGGEPHYESNVEVHFPNERDPSTMTPEEIAADKEAAARLDASFNDPNDHTKPAIGETPIPPPLTSRESFDDTAQLMARYEDEKLPNESREDYVRRKTHEETHLPVSDEDATGHVANDIAATTERRTAVEDRRLAPREEAKAAVEQRLAERRGQPTAVASEDLAAPTPANINDEEGINAYASDKDGGTDDHYSPEEMARYPDSITGEKPVIAPKAPANDIKAPEIVGTLPDRGVAPAMLGNDGKIYVGKVGENHLSVVTPELREIGIANSGGFVDSKGNFLDRRQALEYVNSNGERIRPSDNMDGELDALDYRDQSANVPPPIYSTHRKAWEEANPWWTGERHYPTIDPEAEYHAQTIARGGDVGGHEPPPPGGGEPPMLPPEEPTPKKGFAGNINLDRINGTDDVNQLYRDLAEAMPTREERHQGHAATEELASTMGMTPEQLIAHNPKLTEAPQYAVALRNHLKAAGDRFFEIARKVAGGDSTPETMRDFLLAQARMAALMEKTMEITGVGGRLLDSFKIEAKGAGGYAKAIAKIPNELWSNPDQIRKLAKLVSEQNDPDAVARVVRDATRAKAEDYIFSAWYNWGLLSGPSTHATNIVGNLANVIVDLGSHGFASLLGQARRGSKTGDRVLGRELMARLYGLGMGISNAWPNMKTAFREGAPLDQMNRMERPHVYSNDSTLGVLAEAPTRAMAAEDELFRTITSMSELYGLGVRNASKEGLTGMALIKRANELARNPTDEMLKAAANAGRRLRFMDDPSYVGRMIEKARTVGPGAGKTERVAKGGARFLIPFVRSPDSLIRTALRYSPLGVLDRYNIADWKAGGARRDLAIARVGLGSAVTLYAFMKALNGDITGLGPTDYRKVQELEATGWRPNSVRTADGSYVNIKGYEPFSSNFIAVASIAERIKEGHKEGESNGDIFLKSTMDVARSLNDTAWTKNLTDIAGMFDGRMGDGRAANTVANIASSAVTPAFMRQINTNYVDQYKRDTRGDGTLEGRIAGRIQSAFPGLSQKLPLSYDILGRPIKNPDAYGPDALSKFESSPSDPDPVSHEITRLAGEKTLVGPVGPNINKKRLKPNDYERYQQRAGTLIHGELSKLINSSEYGRMSDDDKRAEIKSIASEMRAQARQELFPKKDDEE